MKNKVNGIRFIIGSNCNYCCFYCHHEGYQNNNLDIWDEKKFEALATYIDKLQITNISITGGEPFLYPERLFKILKRFNNYKYNITLNTNLSLIDKYINELKQLNKIEFHINFSSCCPNTYKNITGKDYLFKVMSNLELLSKTNHLICLNIIVLKNINSKEILNLLKFCNNNNFKARFLVALTDNKNLVLSPEDIIKLIPKSEIESKYSYGIYNVKSIFGNYEIVQCPCINHECEQCINNGYIHITPDFNIKYCMEKEDIFNIEWDNEKLVEKDLKKMLIKWRSNR